MYEQYTICMYGNARGNKDARHVTPSIDYVNEYMDYSLVDTLNLYKIIFQLNKI